MKRFLLLGLIVSMLLLCISCKKKEVVKMMMYNPKDVYGYVILDKKNNPNIKKWEINVVERVYKDSKHYTDSTIYSISLEHENFTKLPDFCFEVSKGIHVVNIIGYDEKGKAKYEDSDEITDKMWVNPIELNSDLCWTCIGYNYAWKIVGNREVRNGSVTNRGYLSLEDATSGINTEGQGIPYYVYMKRDDWNAFTNTSNKWSKFKEFHELYHMLNISSTSPTPIVDNINIIALYHTTAADSLIGYHGQRVFDYNNIIYGVRKTKGYWRRPSIQTSTINEIVNSQSMNDIISTINTNSSSSETIQRAGLPQLACYGQGYKPMQTINNKGFDSNFYNSLLRCWGTLNNVTDIDEWLAAVKKCRDISFPTSTNVLSVVVDRIKPIDDTKDDDSDEDDNGMTVFIDNVISESGKILEKPKKFSPGLYVIGFTTRDQRYAYIIQEVNNELKYEPKYSYYVTIFEKYEIEKNVISISTDAFAKIPAKMEIIDADGKLLYSEDVTIDKGFSKLRVEMPDVLPNGIFNCKFTYQDNSESVIQIINN